MQVCVRDGTCVSAEQTVKGTRAAIKAYGRAGREADEVTAAYDCGLQGRGLHTSLIQKMLTWVIFDGIHEGGAHPI